MSVEALSWALRQPVHHSSAKFVLVVLADCADKLYGTAWPSMSHLCEATSQDRKTVIANIARLKEAGYIEDTSERKGTTKQVVVYRLKSPESGTVKEAQKRDSTENGTVPETDDNSPVFPLKESRFPPERGPKTGHGTIRTIREPSGNQEQRRGSRLPADWTLTDAHRIAAKEIKPDWPTGYVDQVAASFRDYWISQPGARGVKLDWMATWRNWCRSDRGSSRGGGKPSRHDLRGIDYNAGVSADGSF